MLFKKFYFFPFSLIAGDEDGKETNPAPQPDDPEPPSADDVLDIKENFVKKDKYDALNENYQKLIKKTLGLDEDGGDIPPDPNGEDNHDIAELRKELYDPNNSLNNLDYAKKTLKLREKIIEETGQDPFMPTGINGDPFKSDAERDAALQTAQKVAKVLQEAVDEADGDPEAFDIILSKIIK